MGRRSNRPLRVLMVGSAPEAVAPSQGDHRLACEFTHLQAFGEGPLPDSAAFDIVLFWAASLPAGATKWVAEGVRRLRDLAPSVGVIVVVGASDPKTAAAALSAGAWDIVTREEQLADRLHASASLWRAARDQALPEGVDACWREMVGISASMRAVFALIRQVAATDVSVLISGESGTGKELAARAIHERSRRAAGPFVPVNCAAIPETLLESELFGHDRGAFTGANRSRPGVVETAHGGTLFLDEIGEMSPAFQLKLLRFLEDHVVERVGDRRRHQIDVRVIAATNRNLAARVQEGAFREDLYYRVAVLEIKMPPLRARPDDVLLMARLFLQRYAAQEGRDLRGFSADGIEALWKSQWPGNVRELLNRIRRAVVVAKGPFFVKAAELGFEAQPVEAPLLTLREAHARCEADCIRAAMESAGGNRSLAARMLGVSRSTLYQLMQRHPLVFVLGLACTWMSELV